LAEKKHEKEFIQIPEIWETQEEKKLTVKELKTKYTKYAYTHFIKTPSLVLTNKKTEWKIEITTRVIKEWWKKSRTRPRILALQLLDTMIKNAILVKTAKDEKNTIGIESVSEFECWCNIEDKLYKVRIIVKKQPDRYFAYYFGAVEQ
jgi:hypothetical protein